MLRIDFANAVPEPSAWVILLLGAFGLLYARKRKRG
ncbi:MAG: PEP-CTERM sorting domain-containing protein [Thermoguttaceae bacterium]|nr:PEP-CTERM sorting domain-containing protein [Thermoguttaceae bacterium]